MRPSSLAPLLVILVAALAGACKDRLPAQPSPPQARARATPTQQTRPAAPLPPRTGELLAGLRRALEATTSYKAKLAIVATVGSGDASWALRSEARIAAALPYRLHLEGWADQVGRRVPGKVICGGRWCWVSAEHEGKRAVGKVDRRKLARPYAPFDVGLQQNVGGLHHGRDLFGTIRHLLDSYDFELERRAAAKSTSAEPCWIVEGQRGSERLLRELLASREVVGKLSMLDRVLTAQGKSAAPRLAAIVKVARGMSRLRLWISKRDGWPRQWTFGDGSEVKARVTVEAFEPGATIAAETFTLTEAQQAAEDLTARVIHERRVVEAFLSNEAAVARIKDALRRLVARGARRSSAPSN